MVDALKEYFAVSMLKVIDLMFLEGPLFTTVTGITACGSAMTTSVPAGTLSVNVSAKAWLKPERSKKRAMRDTRGSLFMASS